MTKRPPQGKWAPNLPPGQGFLGWKNPVRFTFVPYITFFAVLFIGWIILEIAKHV